MTPSAKPVDVGAFLPPDAFEPFADVAHIDPAVLDHWLEQTTIEPIVARLWHLQQGWAIPERILPADWLVWVDQGAIVLHLDPERKQLTVSEGKLYVLPAGVSHTVTLGRFAPVKLISVHFRARLFSDVSLLELVGMNGAFACPAGSPIPAAMNALCREAAVRAPGYRSSMRSEIARILLYLLRHQGGRLERPMSGVRHEHLARLQPALSLIEGHLARPELSVPDLANELAVSEAYLRRMFRRTLGIPPAQYVQRRRVERAGQLLHYTQLSVKEIARICGFNEAHFFMRVFRKWMGQTPTEFRKRHAL